MGSYRNILSNGTLLRLNLNIEGNIKPKDLITLDFSASIGAESSHDAVIIDGLPCLWTMLDIPPVICTV